MMLEKQILDFVHILRESGVEVPPASVIDCLNALTLIPLYNKDTFKNSLCTTMIKNGYDIELFEALFELFFHHPTEIERWEKSINSFMENDNQVNGGKLLNHLRKKLGTGIEKLSPAFQLLLGDGHIKGRVLMQVLNTTDMLGSSTNPIRLNYQVTTVLSEMDWYKFDEELKYISQILNQDSLPPELIQTFIKEIRKEAKHLREETANLIRERLHRYSSWRLRQLGIESLSEKDFFHLTREEIKKMEEVVKKLALKIKDIYSRKKYKSSAGKLDLKTMMRRNLRYGGLPIELKLKRRRKDRPRIVVICDISNSMRNVSRFMLLFVYSLQEVLSGVRSFVFVDELGESTEIFSRHQFSRAIELIFQGELISPFAHTDYGQSLEIFTERYLDTLDRKTTVIIIGDGRNNYGEPREERLKLIQEQARRLIWLNPESPANWGYGDSEMERYQPYCSLAAQCSNFKQMSKLAEKLLLS